MKDFILINGVGIFRTSEVKQVIPHFADKIEYEVRAPLSSNEDFYFVITNVTEVFLEIQLESSKASQARTVEFNEVIPIISEKVFTLEELVAAFDIDSDAKAKIEKTIKFYKKALGREEQYEITKSSLPSDVNDPTYGIIATSMRELEITPTERAKQFDRISKIENVVAKAIEDASEEDVIDDTLNKLFNRKDDEDFDMNLKTAMSVSLSKFYNANMRDNHDAIDNINRIVSSGDTLTNADVAKRG